MNIRTKSQYFGSLWTVVRSSVLKGLSERDCQGEMCTDFPPVMKSCKVYVCYLSRETYVCACVKHNVCITGQVYTVTRGA